MMTRKTRIKKITLFLTVSFMVLAVALTGALADEAVTFSPEQALLGLINQARQNPLETAASLGMDPEKILADFPDLGNLLQQGLSPLTWNENLAQAARVHTDDMFAQSYYSNISPDGRSHEERICETGYPAVESGESLGMILFANFIDPENAVRLTFEYMFQDELDPLRTEKRNILDPCLQDAGVSFQSGALVMGKNRWNVYLSTCDFGSTLSCPEAELYKLVNQARENPLSMVESLGMNPEEVLAYLPGWHDILTRGLPPLSFNLNLAAAARAHAADMLENGYFGSESLDGRTYVERIRESGYEWFLDTGESLWKGCLGRDDDVLNDLSENNYERIQTLIKETFKNIFIRELWSDKDEDRKILDNSFTEIGIGLAAGVSPELAGICGDRVLALVMDFGSGPQIEDLEVEAIP